MDVTMAGIRAFVEVAERESMRSAADALGYTPSAVSQRVSTLEQRLGVTLFERLGNRIRLTPAGEQMRLRAYEVLAATEAFGVDAAMLSSQRRTVSIGGFPSGMSLVAAPSIADLGELGIDLRLVCVEDAQGQQDLRLGSLDVLLLQEYSVQIPRTDDFAYTRLVTEPLVLVSQQRLASLAASSTLNWIVPAVRTVCGRGVRHVCQGSGFEPNVVADVDDFGLHLDLVAAGLGVAMMPESCALPAAERGLNQLVIPDAERTVFAAIRSSSHSDELLAEVLSVLEMNATVSN